MANIARRGAVAVVVVGLTVVAGCGDDEPASSTTTSGAPSTVPTTSTIAATTSSIEGTVVSTTLSTVVSTLDAVHFVDAGPGGGSGEIALRWDGVDGATGYRVYRATSPEGPFELAADHNVVTGEQDLADGVVTLWSPVGDTPPFTTVPGEDPPQRFELIEVIADGGTQRWFKVVAYDDVGEGPDSAVVCGAPPGQPDC